VSKDTNRILGHADEADGIEEYDNPLPDWWLGLFWFTIIWALVYGVHYHFIADRSYEKALSAEMAAAEERWPAGSMDVEFSLDPEAVVAGEQVYNTNCFVCHGTQLEGGIGPSFLDDEWIHGGDPESVIHTIIEGVPAKGMIPWGPILTPVQINQVAAFVLTRNGQALGIEPGTGGQTTPSGDTARQPGQ
jgi:cytochrome c oxidase cbb3-type subunit 3